jgi:hypothetical protein
VATDAPSLRSRLVTIPDRYVVVGLAVLAFIVRLAPMLLGGGLGFYGRYDDGVYYTAADALSFGRIPYRDFVLLHPPGIMLVLLPFAALGRLTTDLAGLEVARIFFMLIGAANTALVATLARRWGRAAMWVAGAMYACWMPAVYAEQSTFLEVVGGFFVLLTLWLLVRTDRLPTPRVEWIAGISLGLAETMKIWYVAPWATIVVWQLLARRWRSATRLVVGGVVTLVVVVTPFVIASRGRIYDMVIRDQLFRPPASTTRAGRIAGIIGIRTFTKGHGQLRHLFAAIIIVILVVLIVSCLRERKARPIVAVMAVNMAVLFAGPVFFRHYQSFIAGPTAVVVGIGAAGLLPSIRAVPIRRAVPVALVAVLLASGLAIIATPQGKTFPVAAFRRAAPPGCIAADDPIALVEMNRLSADFRQGCRVLVDVTGATYDNLERTGPNGKHIDRVHNEAWHHYLYHYLTGARAFVISRAVGDGLTTGGLHPYRYHFLALASGDKLVLRQGGPPM